MQSAPSGQSSAPTALLVGLDETLAGRIDAALVDRSVSVRRLRSVAEVSRVLLGASVHVVVARAEARAIAELCDTCADVPVIAVVPEGDAEELAALRSGAATTLSDGSSDEEIARALKRTIGEEGPPPSSEDRPPPALHRTSSLLGESEPIRRVVDLISRTAGSGATILVRGETGTGKELVARALHEQSPRKNGPFIKVQCSALPDALLESELFGYERGAFTGATSRKPGRVELAEGGTLFLDEIGDITAATQVKLLRLLQDREYERLGGTRSLRADVRFVTATHRDLEAMVKNGSFREDLFYRLNVVTLWLPPLRARRDDIALLAQEFVGQFAQTYQKSVRLDEGALRALRSERWPGNVRQLQNFVERLVVLATSETLTTEMVQSEMTAQVQFRTQVTQGTPKLGSMTARSPTEPSPVSRAIPLDEAVRAAERQTIERALQHAGGNRTVAARILGVSRATLYTKINELGIT
jgi:two-component system response regulator AtoC